MPTRLVSLDKDGPKRLELSWGGFWKNFTVKLDGAPVLSANGSSELKAGKSATLPDGSTFEVRLATGFGNNGLVLTRDGKALPGSSTDPETQVKLAGGIVYFLAAFNAVLALVGYAFDIGFLKENVGIGGLILGAVFGALGYFTMKGSLGALIASIAIYTLDGIFTIGFAAANTAPGHTPNMGGIFMRVFFLMAMVRGARAIGELRRTA